MVFIPQRKECRYFSRLPATVSGPGFRDADYAIQTAEAYRDLFRQAKPGQLLGDVSPDYLYYHHNAVPGILKEISARAPIIIVLRNPVDRAYSNYVYHITEGRETLGFEAALEAESGRRAAGWGWGWSYTGVGLYAAQVKAYLDNFERVLVMLFEEDIVTGTATNKVLDFLGLEPFPEGPDKVHVNVSGYPKNRILHRLMTDKVVVRKVKNIVKATPLYVQSKKLFRKVMGANLEKRPMSPQTRQLLKEKFGDDVALLEEYTGLPVRKFWGDFQ